MSIYSLGSGKMVRLDTGKTLAIGTVILQNRPYHDQARYVVVSLDTMHGGQMCIDPETLEATYVWASAAREVMHDYTIGAYTIENDTASEEEATELMRRHFAKRETDNRAANEVRKAADLVKAQGETEFERRRPTWAKAVIVAVLETNDCDHQTDYFNVKRGRVVFLAWSKHTRDLFPEMRKAAARFEETAHLATPPDVDDNGYRKTEDNKKWWHPADENRNKYSMGDGYFLKVDGSYASGWKVKKEVLEWASFTHAADPANWKTDEPKIEVLV